MDVLDHPHPGLEREPDAVRRDCSFTSEFPFGGGGRRAPGYPTIHSCRGGALHWATCHVPPTRNETRGVRACATLGCATWLLGLSGACGLGSGAAEQGGRYKKVGVAALQSGAVCKGFEFFDF